MTFASDDVKKIWHCIEDAFRAHKGKLVSKNIFNTLMTETLQNVPLNIFTENSKLSNQETINDHRGVLIYLIAKHYINLRLKHESDKLNDAKVRVRTYYNKLTTFLGQ